MVEPLFAIALLACFRNKRSCRKQASARLDRRGAESGEQSGDAHCRGSPDGVQEMSAPKRNSQKMAHGERSRATAVSTVEEALSLGIEGERCVVEGYEREDPFRSMLKKVAPGTDRMRASRTSYGRRRCAVCWRPEKVLSRSGGFRLDTEFDPSRV